MALRSRGLKSSETVFTEATAAAFSKRLHLRVLSHLPQCPDPFRFEAPPPKCSHPPNLHSSSGSRFQLGLVLDHPHPYLCPVLRPARRPPPWSGADLLEVLQRHMESVFAGRLGRGMARQAAPALDAMLKDLWWVGWVVVCTIGARVTRKGRVAGATAAPVLRARRCGLGNR